VKKVTSFLLLIIICVNHLNIIDSLLNLSENRNNTFAKMIKNILIDEESDIEKESEGKEKTQDPEKYYTEFEFKSLHNIAFYNNHLGYIATLNKHPYQELDAEPPKS